MTTLRGKRVTVTGGTGFLGRFVIEKLHQHGAEVFVPRSQTYDLTKADDTNRMYRDANPQLLVHCAARVGGIGINQNSPGLFFYENAAMGLNVVEGARQHTELEKLVVIGTTCSYPKFTPVPFKEDDIWNGFPEETNSPYAIAKRSLLAMSWAYRQQYGMNIIYLIPANLYGPRDNFNPETSHVIPALIRKFVEAQEQNQATVEVWGTGRVSREFLHAEDAAEGIICAATHYDDAEPVNLATGSEITILELANLIGNLVGFNGQLVWDSSKPDGQPRRCLDTSRAERFGFKARRSFEEGLRETIAWYRANPSDEPSATKSTVL